MFNEKSNGLIPILSHSNSEVIESSVCYWNVLVDFGAVSGLSEYKRYKVELLLAMACIEAVFGRATDDEVKYTGIAVAKLYSYFKAWARANELIVTHGKDGNGYSTLSDKGKSIVALFWDTYHKRLARFREQGANQYPDYMPYLERKDYTMCRELRKVLPTVKKCRARSGTKVNLSKYLSDKPQRVKEHFDINDKAKDLEFT